MGQAMSFPHLGCYRLGRHSYLGPARRRRRDQLAGRALSKQSEELTELKKEVQDGKTLVTQQSKLIGIQSGQLEEQRRLTTEQVRVLELQRREERVAPASVLGPGCSSTTFRSRGQTERLPTAAARRSGSGSYRRERTGSWRCRRASGTCSTSTTTRST